MDMWDYVDMGISDPLNDMNYDADAVDTFEFDGRHDLTESAGSDEDDILYAATVEYVVAGSLVALNESSLLEFVACVEAEAASSQSGDDEAEDSIVIDYGAIVIDCNEAGGAIELTEFTVKVEHSTNTGTSSR